MYELFRFIVETQEYRGAVQSALVIALCLYAILFGSRPEKWVMGAWVLLIELSNRLLNKIFYGSELVLNTAETLHLTALIDFVLFEAWLIVGLMANRLYITFAAGAQFITAASILFYDPEVPRTFMAFAFASVGGSWIALLAIAGGFIAHYRRFRSGQDYPDWRWQVARARVSTA